MKKLLSILLAATLTLSFSACSGDSGTEETNTASETTIAVTDNTDAEDIAIDRTGKEYIIPEEINAIISCAPSCTEMLSGLGLADRIIAADTYSYGIEGLADDYVQLDIMNLDMEYILSLNPDVVFLDSINYLGQEDKYSVLTDAGISIVAIPATSSIEDIMDDIVFMSEYTGTAEKGAEIVAGMKEVIEDIESKVALLSSNPPTVFFETSPPDYLATAASGTFINEMIEICGAKNIFDDLESWPLVSEEDVIKRNPSVIITNCDWDTDPVNNIMTRDGWNVIEAVKNERVYLVGSNATSRPSQKIVNGLMQVAKAIRPELFE